MNFISKVTDSKMFILFFLFVKLTFVFDKIHACVSHSRHKKKIKQSPFLDSLPSHSLNTFFFQSFVHFCELKTSAWFLLSPVNIVLSSIMAMQLCYIQRRHFALWMAFRLLNQPNCRKVSHATYKTKLYGLRMTVNLRTEKQQLWQYTSFLMQIFYSLQSANLQI